ncbi:hypothetical protein LshimejAT787_0502300 [Lyophyllum shimeji]|uniref:Uncharacterized protein n=1 Tax=Lyophyllum shimeji TaxID=47721 RepID=A0A9P3UNX3_LYOSH|nr:hypothetical protein LshimejAT787_0502300 [Lyophyllum shimeji]
MKVRPRWAHAFLVKGILQGFCDRDRGKQTFNKSCYTRLVQEWSKRSEIGVRPASEVRHEREWYIIYKWIWRGAPCHRDPVLQLGYNDVFLTYDLETPTSQS